MRVPFYDLPAQWRDLDPGTEHAVIEKLRSGGYMLGPEHAALEKEFAEAHGVRHGIAVANGSDALRILMEAAGIGPGDEIITTAFTFVSSVETIVQTGAIPVLVEVDPASFMIDPEAVAAAVTPRTKGILPVHLFGGVAPMGTLMEIAEKNGLIILEDAAQAVNATLGGRPAGSFGLGAGFSFYPTKNLGAAGDAGIIVTDDDGMAERCRSIRVHGMGRERYYYDRTGYTSRLDEIQALILRAKMAVLPRWDARRRQIADRYLAEMRGPILPTHPADVVPTWHQFSVRSERRDELQSHLKTHEVDAMIYYPVPLHLHAPYRHLAAPGSLPLTEKVCRDVLCLPIHPHLTDEQVGHVIETVNHFEVA